MDATYDGNMLAGPLSDVFAVEVTTATACCRGCGRRSTVAELAVYGPSPGLVARCPGCDDVLLRVTTTPDGIWLDLGGMAHLRLPVVRDDPAASGPGQSDG